MRPVGRVAELGSLDDSPYDHVKTKKIADKALVGLAGEYHVLAQLAERGYVGALTLAGKHRDEGVDISRL